MIILGTNSIKDTGFDVANSVRFNSGSSDYLNRTPDSQSTNKFTWSAWIKRSKLSSFEVMWNERPDDNNFTQAYWESGSPVDSLSFQSYKSGSYHYDFKTNRLFRDPSAWYHIIFILDTTLGTQADRIKIYVNGVRETSFHTSTNNISQNDTLSVNSNTSNNLKLGSNGSSGFFNGYMCEVVYVSNNALAHTDLGEFDEDSGIWKPINVSGLTFDTAGYYLDFENSGALGADVSGNSNNFTVNNLTAIDQSTDTCTNNFATWNPLENFYQSNTYSEGNLQVQTQNTSFTYNFATIGVSTGKWYWEVEYDAKSGGTDQPMIGITSTQPTSNDHELGNFPNDFAWYTDNGTGYLANNNTYSDEGFNAYTVGDVISVALDLDNNKLYFAKNGTWEKSGNPESGSTGTGAISITATASTPLGIYFPSVGDAINSQNATFKTNFGNPIVTGTDKTDGNSRGSFEYEPPSGYFALCTKNLAEYG